MTITPETPEQIIARAMSGGNRAYSTHDVQVVAVGAALRAAGLLAGDPTEEQIDAAGRVMFEHWDEWADDPDDDMAKGNRQLVRDGLTAAAGVAPQEPSAHGNPVATSGACAKN